jgi:hypothetical protein
LAFMGLGRYYRTASDGVLAEREGFEPSIRFKAV